MKKLLIVRLIIIVALGDVAKSGDLALNWTSSSVFPNGTVVKAYFGDNVTFPWEIDIHTPEGFVMNSTAEFVMNSTEEFVIEWTKTSENNSDQNILALLAKNTFIGLSRERHVEFLPNAGINLPNVTMADSGVYTVEITLFGQGKSYNQVAFLQVYGVFDLKWKSSSVFPNGTVVKANVGDNVTFPWEIDIHTPEEFVIEWTKTSENNPDQNKLSVLAKDIFYGLSRERDVEFLPNAGIKLPNVTMADMGVYTVEITLFGQGKSYKQVAFLQVSDVPVTTSDELHAFILPESVYNSRTGLWQVQLGCRPPVITTMVQRNNDNITAIIHSRLDNFAGMVQSKFDTITDMVQSKIDGITTIVQSKFDNITAMVPKNDDNITAMVQSMLDTFAGMVQNKFDTITDMVQSKIDGISSMVQSKSDNVNATVLQPQSGPMDSERRPASCVDVQKYDKVSGVHTLFVNNNIPIKVYCDQQTDNGGWTVFQRRQDGSVDFTRNWEEYEKGFGDVNGEFWIGLANLHQLTKSKTVKLRVDLTDIEDSTAYAVYNTFSISDADDNYRLNVDGYSGTAGDSLASHNEMQFSTLDRDHDTAYGGSCVGYNGGWWFHNCHDSNLNSYYHVDPTSRNFGASWSSWKGGIPFKRVEMKIKE